MRYFSQPVLSTAKPGLVLKDIHLGENVRFHAFVNAYGCKIDDDTSIGPFVEIQRNAQIGKRCKVQSHTFICEGVRICDECFIGHGVMFMNDDWPRACTTEGHKKQDCDWCLLPTVVERGATIGSGAIIRGGITIGEKAMVGAGAVVTRDVRPYTVVVGNPARYLRDVIEA